MGGVFDGTDCHVMTKGILNLTQEVRGRGRGKRAKVEI